MGGYPLRTLGECSLILNQFLWARYLHGYDEMVHSISVGIIYDIHLLIKTLVPYENAKLFMA